MRTLIVLTSHEKLGNTGKQTGYYLSEVVHPYMKLVEAGISVDFASPEGGKAPMDESSRNLEDPELKKFLSNPELMKRLENTLKTDQVKASDYQAIVFAGGHGTMWDFPSNKALANLTAQIYDNGGVVAAVCHGPAALVNVVLKNGKKLIENKNLTSFTNEEETIAELTKVVPFSLQDGLVAQGANFKTSKPWSENVVVDGRLVTGQNPQSASLLGEKVAGLLKANN